VLNRRNDRDTEVSAKYGSKSTGNTHRSRRLHWYDATNFGCRSSKHHVGDNVDGDFGIHPQLHQPLGNQTAKGKHQQRAVDESKRLIKNAPCFTPTTLTAVDPTPPTSIPARDSSAREFGRGGIMNGSAGHWGDVMNAQFECQGDLLVYALMVCLATMFRLSGKGWVFAQPPVLGDARRIVVDSLVAYFFDLLKRSGSLAVTDPKESADRPSRVDYRILR
jgi:hypothetical protein